MLAALLICAMIIECVCVQNLLDTLECRALISQSRSVLFALTSEVAVAPPPYSGFRGCYIFSGSSILFIAFLTIGFIESGVFS